MSNTIFLNNCDLKELLGGLESGKPFTAHYCGIHVESYETTSYTNPLAIEITDSKVSFKTPYKEVEGAYVDVSKSLYSNDLFFTLDNGGVVIIRAFTSGQYEEMMKKI